MKKILIQFRSKVSRRIFVTVFLCSILPISALVGLTYYNVQTKVFRDTDQRLHYAGKNVGVTIMAKLNSLQQNLKNEAVLRDFGTRDKIIVKQYETYSNESSFLTSWFFPEWVEAVNGLPSLTHTIKTRLASGLPHLEITHNQQQDMTLLLWVPVLDQNNAKGVAVGKIDLESFWLYVEKFLPPNTWFSIFDEKYRPLFQETNKELVDSSVVQRIQEEKTKYHEINLDGQTWLVGNWNLFLLAGFNSSSWLVVVGEPKSLAFSSLNNNSILQRMQLTHFHQCINLTW
jgi:hypothetical protein